MYGQNLHEKYLEGFKPSPDVPTRVVQSVVDFRKFMGLEMSEENVKELLTQHS